MSDSEYSSIKSGVKNSFDCSWLAELCPCLLYALLTLVLNIFMCYTPPLILQGLHRLEKYLNKQGCLVVLEKWICHEKY